MTSPIKNLLIAASVAALLTGCAASSDVEDLKYQLRIVNKKLEDMKSTTVGDLQKRQAAASGQMDQLENDLLELKSQLEESYYLNQKLREQNKELEVSISTVAQYEAAQREEALGRLEKQQKLKEAEIAELNNKLLIQQESVKRIQEARIKDAERRAQDASLAAAAAKKRSSSIYKETGSTASRSIKATKKKVKRSVVAPPVQKAQKSTTVTKTTAKQPASKTVAPVVQQPKNDPPENTYSQAEKAYQKGKYKEAYTLYKEVASTTSSGNSVAARFMMGESLYMQKEYDKAIMQYQKIISQHSSDPKAPAAMLKQSMAFQKLADKDTAKVIYKKLLKKHGGSPEAVTAKEYLEKL
jgi:TolA-binding protein